MGMADLDQVLSDNVSSPRKAAADGVSVEQRSVSEIIEADKYIRSKAAARRGGLAAIRRSVAIPPGSVGSAS